MHWNYQAAFANLPAFQQQDSPIAMSSFSRFSGLLLAATLPLSAYAELPAERIEPSINAELAAHTQVFAQQVYRIADNVYSAVGWQLGNVVMIEAPQGLIIVDTGESVSESRKIMAEFRKLTDKPVKAVVYTHFHPDHINGVQAFVSREQVERGEVQIYAHETLLQNVVAQGAWSGRFSACARRTASVRSCRAATRRA